MKKYFTLFLSLFLWSCAGSPAEQGDSDYQNGKYQAAIQEYDKALESDPENYQIELKKASANEHAGHTDKALAAYSALIKKFPQKATPRLYRARLLFKMNDDITALKDLDRVLTAYESAGEDTKILAHSLEGEIYYNQNDMKKSAESFATALSKAEELTEFKATEHYGRLLYNAGRVEFALGNFKRSREYFEKYVERKKLNGVALDEDDNYFYALVLKYNGEFEKAKEYESQLSPESKDRLGKEISK